MIRLSTFLSVTGRGGAGVVVFMLALLSIFCAQLSYAAADERVQTLAREHKEPLLSTLKDLVAIESGSGDREGLDKISALIHERLAALGGKAEFVEPGADAYRMQDTPKNIGRMVMARFEGTGSRKILLPEYVVIDSIEPRLYLATRLIVDIAQGKGR